MHKSTFIVIFVFIGLTNTLFAQEFEELSFSDAIQKGLAHNIDLRKNQNQLNALEISKTSARLNYLPNVFANLQAARQDGQQFQLVEDGFEIKNVQADRFSAGLSASLSVFEGFSRSHQLKISDYDYAAQLKGIERSKQRVVFTIGQQYLQVLLDKKLVEIAEQNIENQQKQLAQIEGFVNAGLRPLADQYTQKATLSQLELDYIQVENNYFLDKALLAQTLQLDPLYEFEVTSESLMLIPAENIYQLPTLYDRALNHRADLQQLNLQQLSSERSLAASKSSFMPSLRAFYQYGTQYSSLNSLGFQEQFFDLYPNNTVGLNLSIPLFSNYANKVNTAQAKVTVANNQLDEEALKRRIFQDVQNAHLNYKAAFKRKDVSRNALQAAKEASNIQNKRYAEGLSTLAELAFAQQNLVTAQANLQQANYNLVFQQKIIDFHIGTLGLESIE
ncbi:MAG: outer membrane protein [Marivirga sp.]|jgi:outer membrane protein